jgi:hypothetical protein
MIFKKWLTSLHLNFQFIGVNILPPPLFQKLVLPFFKIEKYMERKIKILNLFGYRLVFIVRK